MKKFTIGFCLAISLSAGAFQSQALEPGGIYQGHAPIFGYTKVYTYGDPSSLVIKKFNKHVLEFAFNTASISYNSSPPEWYYDTTYVKKDRDTDQYYIKHGNTWDEADPYRYNGRSSEMRTYYNYGIRNLLDTMKENIKNSLDWPKGSNIVTTFIKYSGADITRGNSSWNTKSETDHKLNFFLDNQGNLHLKDQNLDKDMLSFIPSDIDAFNHHVHYQVSKIITDNPHKEFFQIIANGGTPTRNYGYWLVGLHKNRWVSYLSKDTFYNYGFGRPSLGTNETWTMNSEFFYDSAYPDWYPNTFFVYDETGSGADSDTKHVYQIFWDTDADWIGVAPLPQYTLQYLLTDFPSVVVPIEN